MLLGFFTNSSQYKNANIASFILAESLERNWTSPDLITSMDISHHVMLIKKETSIIWEYKVGNNANIANFCVCERSEMFFFTN